MSVFEAIAEAERLLPGTPAPDRETDPRWQAIMRVEDFIPAEPEVIWPFVLKWGSHENEDLRWAIATCLLEDLFKYHFDLIIERVELAAKANSWFAKTTQMCWKLGQAQEPTRAARFDRLCSQLHEAS